MRILTASLMLGAMLVAGCETGPAPPAAGGLRLVEVDDAEELVQALDSLTARAVVVNVWATWCGPCIVEFPEFIRYDGAMEDELVEVRFLSVDDPEVRARVVQFLQQRGWEETAYLATSQDVVEGLAFAARTMWDGSIPTTFILTDGKVRDMWVGTTTYGMLAARVDRVLGAPPADEAAELR
jgi:thiol-disulfide isomerase/thioredoxin